jgi:hypothetical protein
MNGTNDGDPRVIASADAAENLARGLTPTGQRRRNPRHLNQAQVRKIAAQKRALREAGGRGRGRFTVKERRAIILHTFKLLRNLINPTEVAKVIVARYMVSDSSAWRYIRQAREYAAARFAGNKDLLRGEFGAFYLSLAADENNRTADRIAAAERVCKLYGLYAPERIVSASLNADAEADAEALAAFRQSLDTNDAAVEAMHRLNEAMGAGEARV